MSTIETGWLKKEDLWLTGAAPLSILLAGIVGNEIDLSAKQSSSILYATAGIVTIVLANNILPHILYTTGDSKTVSQKRLAAVAGVIAGSITMLLVRKYLTPEHPLEVTCAKQKTISTSSSKFISLKDYHPEGEFYPWLVVITSAIDIFIGGIVSGMGFGFEKTKASMGLRIAIENGMISLSLMEKLKAHSVEKFKRLQTILSVTGLSLLGDFIGFHFGKTLEREGVFMTAIFGFATVIVSWLIIVELLPEAQLVKDNEIAGPASYFGGMLAGVGLEWFAG